MFQKIIAISLVTLWLLISALSLLDEIDLRAAYASQLCDSVRGPRSATAQAANLSDDPAAYALSIQPYAFHSSVITNTSLEPIGEQKQSSKEGLKLYKIYSVFLI